MRGYFRRKIVTDQMKLIDQWDRRCPITLKYCRLTQCTHSLTSCSLLHCKQQLNIDIRHYQCSLTIRALVEAVSCPTVNWHERPLSSVSLVNRKGSRGQLIAMVELSVSGWLTVKTICFPGLFWEIKWQMKLTRVYNLEMLMVVGINRVDIQHFDFWWVKSQ